MKSIESHMWDLSEWYFNFFFLFFLFDLQEILFFYEGTNLMYAPQFGHGKRGEFVPENTIRDTNEISSHIWWIVRNWQMIPCAQQQKLLTEN